MVRMQIQAFDLLEGTEHDGQKQLCVPFVQTGTDSYRLHSTRTRKKQTRS